jgi:hypothetical protein
VSRHHPDRERRLALPVRSTDRRVVKTAAAMITAVALLFVLAGAGLIAWGSDGMAIFGWGAGGLTTALIMVIRGPRR